MRRVNVMVVFGTRPEAIKMAPVVKELRKHPDRIRVIVTLTAQHREMLDQVLELFHVRADYDLDLMTRDQTLSSLTSAVITRLGAVIEREPVDLLLVQGDTTTTFCAALSAFYRHIPVGHVEAGLRTHDKYYPFPEEVNRTLTSCLSSVHFAPTELAKSNLLSEGIPGDSIIVTGNTVIDALLSVVETEGFANTSSNNGRKEILVTAHRRESFGKPLEEICKALLDIAAKHPDVSIVFPVHLNPKVQASVRRYLAGHGRIRLTVPLGYRDFARQIASSYLILTDSGGVQEEAPALGKPVLVLRNETERQEGLKAGTCRLVGPHRQRILDAVETLLADSWEYSKMARAVNPYGDGKAAQRIVEFILEHF